MEYAGSLRSPERFAPSIMPQTDGKTIENTTCVHHHVSECARVQRVWERARARERAWESGPRREAVAAASASTQQHGGCGGSGC